MRTVAKKSARHSVGTDARGASARCTVQRDRIHARRLLRADAAARGPSARVGLSRGA
jgi:hypothetical protein